MPKFNSYDMPPEAQDFELGEFFLGRAQCTTQRNNWAVDWTRRKWYHLGFRWLADFSAVDTYGLWVGDLDDLSLYSWLPFDVSSFDPDAHANFHSYIGLVAFEGTKYLGVAVAHESPSTRTDYLLIDTDTGEFVASATASNTSTAANNEVAPYLLPTTDANIWHSFNMINTASDDTSRWGVIEWNLTTESVTVLVDYPLVPAGLQNVIQSGITKGREGSTFNTVFVPHDHADDGRIFEITIPHNTSSASDLSFEEILTIAGLESGDSSKSVYYEAANDKIVYAYGPRIGSSPYHKTYEAVARTNPSVVLWTHLEEGTTPGSTLEHSSYHFYNLTGCTCLDTLNSVVIDISTGTVTGINKGFNHNTVQGIRFNVIDMSTNLVYNVANLEFVDDATFDDNDFVWPSEEIGISFPQAYRMSLDLLYLNGACGLTGISFGEEKDPNYVDFASI